MLVAIGCSFVLSLIVIPFIIRIAKAHSWYDSVDPRKIHKGNIPRLGGMGIFLASVLSIIYYCIVNKFFNINYIPLLLGALIIFTGGLVDDFVNLKAKVKFIIQIIAVLVLALGPVYFTDFLTIKIPSLAGRILTFCLVLTLVNAYNLIDGLDLLCGGLSFFTILTFGIVFTFYGNPISVFFFIVCAAIFGFLIFNAPPARIFLGDSGSQTLGYFIAVAPLFNTNEKFESMELMLLILLVSIPLTDVLAAIWRRKRDKRSFFSPDRAHIHHKFLNIGFSRGATIFFLLLIQFLICFAAVSFLFIKGRRQGLILLATSLAFVWLIFIIIHYVNRAVNRRLNGHLPEYPE